MKINRNKLICRIEFENRTEKIFCLRQVQHTYLTAQSLKEEERECVFDAIPMPITFAHLVLADAIFSYCCTFALQIATVKCYTSFTRLVDKIDICCSTIYLKTEYRCKDLVNEKNVHSKCK